MTEGETQNDTEDLADGLKRSRETADNLGEMRAIILAGGKGTRLAPYTRVLPKPLMPIGTRSIIEIVVEQLKRSGFGEITLCVGYLAHLIQAVLGNGDISYVHEPEPLGTAGPLRLVHGLDETFLAMNGDVLTSLDYSQLVEHHRAAGNMLTIATHRRITKLDYGVVYVEGDEAAGARVSSYVEKPEIPLLVSMGIYVLEPRALDFIPSDTYFDFPQLVHELLHSRERVGAFTSEAFWLDIGRPEDYEQAQEAWENGDVSRSATG